jgi:hypothetical protein
MEEKLNSWIIRLFVICLISSKINAEDFETTEGFINSDTTEQVIFISLKNGSTINIDTRKIISAFCGFLQKFLNLNYLHLTSKIKAIS